MIQITSTQKYASLLQAEIYFQTVVFIIQNDFEKKKKERRIYFHAWH